MTDKRRTATDVEPTLAAGFDTNDEGGASNLESSEKRAARNER